MFSRTRCTGRRGNREVLAVWSFSCSLFLSCSCFRPRPAAARQKQYRINPRILSKCLKILVFMTKSQRRTEARPDEQADDEDRDQNCQERDSGGRARLLSHQAPFPFFHSCRDVTPSGSGVSAFFVIGRR